MTNQVYPYSGLLAREEIYCLPAFAFSRGALARLVYTIFWGGSKMAYTRVKSCARAAMAKTRENRLSYELILSFAAMTKKD